MSYNSSLEWYESSLSTLIPAAGDVQPVTVESIMDDDMASSDSENTVAVIMILSLKHQSTSSAAYNTFTRLQGYGPSKKRQKIEATWTRIYIFADLRDPGRCGVLVLSSNRACQQLFGNSQEQTPIVGSTYLLVEPRPTPDRKRLGPLAMVSSDHALIPLRHYSSDISIKEAIPHVNDLSPMNAGDQRYFVFHGKQVELNLFELKNEGTCRGIQCDKAMSLETANQYCGCMYTCTNRGSYVGQCTVAFDNPFSSVVHEGSRVEVHKFRSLRTTELFFRKLGEFVRHYKKDDHFAIVRKKVKKMSNFINENGGWTMVGWFRKGEISDASNEAEKVENLIVTVHISLLVPTKTQLYEDNAFKSKRIKTPTLAPQIFDPKGPDAQDDTQENE